MKKETQQRIETLRRKYEAGYRTYLHELFYSGTSKDHYDRELKGYTVTVSPEAPDSFIDSCDGSYSISQVLPTPQRKAPNEIQQIVNSIRRRSYEQLYNFDQQESAFTLAHDALRGYFNLGNKLLIASLPQVLEDMMNLEFYPEKNITDNIVVFTSPVVDSLRFEETDRGNELVLRISTTYTAYVA